MAVELSISKGDAEARQERSPIAALRRISQSAARQDPLETCELCGAAIGERHLGELIRRKMETLGSDRKPRVRVRERPDRRPR